MNKKILPILLLLFLNNAYAKNNDNNHNYVKNTTGLATSIVEGDDWCLDMAQQ